MNPPNNKAQVSASLQNTSAPKPALPPDEISVPFNVHGMSGGRLVLSRQQIKIASYGPDPEAAITAYARSQFEMQTNGELKRIREAAERFGGDLKYKIEELAKLEESRALEPIHKVVPGGQNQADSSARWQIILFRTVAGVIVILDYVAVDALVRQHLGDVSPLTVFSYSAPAVVAIAGLKGFAILAINSEEKLLAWRKTLARCLLVSVPIALASLAYRLSLITGDTYASMAEDASALAPMIAIFIQLAANTVAGTASLLCAEIIKRDANPRVAMENEVYATISTRMDEVREAKRLIEVSLSDTRAQLASYESAEQVFVDDALSVLRQYQLLRNEFEQSIGVKS